MAGNNFTLRLDDSELRVLEAHARALGRPRADVVRLALAGLSRQQKNAEALDALRLDLATQLSRQIEQSEANLAGMLRRSNLLFLKVLNAPKEAEAALEKIYEV